MAAPRVETVPIDQLIPYPGNARIHNLAAITDSLTVNGQYRPLLAQRTTRHVLVGNGTLEAATQLGWTHIQTMWADVDDQAARRIVLADNRTTDLATYDESALVALLEPLGVDLAGTGYTMDDLETLLGPATIPPAPFEGDFAESQAETERRRNTGTALASQGYREVILVLRQDQLDTFTDHIARLREAWATESTTATVLEAITRAVT
jgi:ParB-like chromosome segregation protein Spo0J